MEGGIISNGIHIVFFFDCETVAAVKDFFKIFKCKFNNQILTPENVREIEAAPNCFLFLALGRN